MCALATVRRSLSVVIRRPFPVRYAGGVSRSNIFRAYRNQLTVLTVRDDARDLARRRAGNRPRAGAGVQHQQHQMRAGEASPDDLLTGPL